MKDCKYQTIPQNIETIRLIAESVIPAGMTVINGLYEDGDNVEIRNKFRALTAKIKSEDPTISKVRKAVNICVNKILNQQDR